MYAYLSIMNAVLTDDGKIVLPPKLRADARLQPGDTLDVQFYKGSIILRKHQPLTPEQCAALLERSRSQPQPAPDDDVAVEQVLREVRAQRR
jgi:bifunctional DNA-binding transcriptional regulator/antitoxin component of YhaV-PrlF toxin-antitoxin module